MKITGFQDTIEWYNQHAKKYAAVTVQKIPQEEIDQFTKLLPHGAHILDAGCGAGRDTNIFSQEGFEAIGLDISSGLIDVARKAYPRCTFIEGSMRAIPFSDSYFDGIWCHASLLHLETQQEVVRVLSELSRVLKPDGIIHVLVKAKTGKSKTAVVSDSLSHHDRFFQYFTNEEMQMLLKKSGFEILFISQYKESDKYPSGRPEVSLILVLARKK